jgi:uncharacterized protein DUF4265
MNNKDSFEREQWEALPEIYVRLEKDAVGYPPKDWEQLKAVPASEEGRFRIKSIPFYARGLALEDEVSITTSNEGYFPVFKAVAKRSGYSTMRLMIDEKEDRQRLIEYFVRLDTLIEFDGRLVALGAGIPRMGF